MRAAVAFLLALAIPAWGQASDHLGPVPSRDQFPLNLLTLTYQPAPPDTLAAGAWQADLQCVEANTLEFSDVIKDDLSQNPGQRLDITRAWAQGIAEKNPSLPVVFLFQMETTMTTLRLRAGLGHGREASVELPLFSYAGGFEDGLINQVHSLGFYQAGRSAFPVDQVRLAVIQQGSLVYYSDRSAAPRLQDPVFGLTQSLNATPDFALSANAKVKPAMMRSQVGVRAGWDWGLQLTARWSPNPSMDIYFGLGGVRRESGSLAFNQLGFRNQFGAHFMVEGWRESAWRPFLQLLLLSGAAYPMAGQKLGLSSLQHDLGVHWVRAPGLVFTLSYMNNITNNENTADMAFSLEMTWRFGRR